MKSACQDESRLHKRHKITWKIASWCNFISFHRDLSTFLVESVKSSCEQSSIRGELLQRTA